MCSTQIVEFWDSELSLSVYLNLGYGWFMISVLPEPKNYGIDGDELLRVAVSMRPLSEG